MADPGFPPGGGVNPPIGRDFAKFSQRLDEIERIWTPGGLGRTSLTPLPLDPPMTMTLIQRAEIAVPSQCDNMNIFECIIE